jgi:hypothetical protein
MKTDAIRNAPHRKRGRRVFVRPRLDLLRLRRVAGCLLPVAATVTRLPKALCICDAVDYDTQTSGVKTQATGNRQQATGNKTDNTQQYEPAQTTRNPHRPPATGHRPPATRS